MTYVRHRVRMVHESVVEDLSNTLIACRWLAGTTTHQVNNPAGGLYEVVTTEEDEVFALVADDPISVINYFPDPTSGPPDVNTLAIDMPRPADPEPLEMGSIAVTQPYQFAMAFYAKDDATAQALLSDLADRYGGRIVNGQAIALYDYLTDPNTVVSYMEVDVFRFARDVEHVNNAERTMYYCELEVTDVV